METGKLLTDRVADEIVRSIIDTDSQVGIKAAQSLRILSHLDPSLLLPINKTK